VSKPSITAAQSDVSSIQPDGSTDIPPPPPDDCRPSYDGDLHGYPAACGLPTVSTARNNEFVALDGTGMMPISGGRPLLYSATGLGGYDTAFAGIANTPSAFTGIGGYIAMLLGRPTGFFLLQNTVNSVFYSAGGGTTQYFDNASLAAGHSISEHWSWGATVNNAVGNDALRVLTPLNTSNLNNLAVPSSETPSYAVQTGMVLDNDVSFSMEQMPGRGRTWRLLARNSYRHVFDTGQSDNTVHLRAEYDMQVSPRSTWGFYEETAHESGAILCTTQSVGFNAQRQVFRHSVLQLAGGPAVGTKSCVTTLTGVFYGSLTSQVSRSVSLYASGSRKLNDSLIQNATWEDTVQGGVLTSFGPTVQLRADVGFLRGTQPSPLTNFNSTFEGVQVNRLFGNGFSVALSARHFQYSGSTSTLPNRTQILATINWSSGRSSKNPTEVGIR
jgi:hypothetical protein